MAAMLMQQGSTGEVDTEARPVCDGLVVCPEF